MLPLTPFTRSSNFDLIEFILNWPVIIPLPIRSSHRRFSVRKSVLKNFATFCNFIKKETLEEVFPCEICKISENTFFPENLRTIASEYC